MTRLNNWTALWDRLRNEVKNGSTSLGRNQIIELMDQLEREMVRKNEIDNLTDDLGIGVKTIE